MAQLPTGANSAASQASKPHTIEASQLHRRTRSSRRGTLHGGTQRHGTRSSRRGTLHVATFTTMLSVHARFHRLTFHSIIIKLARYFLFPRYFFRIFLKYFPRKLCLNVKKFLTFKKIGEIWFQNCKLHSGDSKPNRTCYSKNITPCILKINLFCMILSICSAGSRSSTRRLKSSGSIMNICKWLA